jgi:hypothetical protein
VPPPPSFRFWQFEPGPQNPPLDDEELLVPPSPLPPLEPPSPLSLPQACAMLPTMTADKMAQAQITESRMAFLPIDNKG